MNGTRIIGLLMLVWLAACKGNPDDHIPYAAVNLYIDLNDPRYSDLTVIGGAMEFKGGVRGIIVYREDIEVFRAWDQNCSFQPYDACAIADLEKSSLSAVDSCCGSEFSISTGLPLKGPASRPLKGYATYYNNNILQVSN